MAKKLEKNISRYFGYYDARLKNLNKLFRRKTRIKKLKTSIPVFRNEVRLLALCYLDALRASAYEKSIGAFISRFSKESLIPDLVSTGRVYSFASFLLRITTPTASGKPISSYLNRHFGNADVKQLERILNELQSHFPKSSQFRLLLKSLKEFTWDELQNARTSDIIVPVTGVDKDPSTLYDRFVQFVNRGPDPFLSEYDIPHKVNRVAYRSLIRKSLPKEVITRLFKSFRFSEIFRRDYRNPMVHKTISLSQGRELPVDASGPYYWFNAVRSHKIRLEIVVPDKYWIDTLKTCLKSYKRYCRKESHDPIPTDFQILR